MPITFPHCQRYCKIAYNHKSTILLTDRTHYSSPFCHQASSIFLCLSSEDIDYLTYLAQSVGHCAQSYSPWNQSVEFTVFFWGRTADYQRSASAITKYCLFQYCHLRQQYLWSFASDSNRQPTAYKAVALTIAPAKRIYFITETPVATLVFDSYKTKPQLNLHQDRRVIQELQARRSLKYDPIGCRSGNRTPVNRVMSPAWKPTSISAILDCKYILL